MRINDSGLFAWIGRTSLSILLHCYINSFTGILLKALRSNEMK